MDIIRDILERLAKALPAGTLTDKVSQQIQQEVRQHWAGDRIYISRQGDDLSERNAAIMRDWLNGERPALLCRRYKISRVRLWQIVKNDRRAKPRHEEK